MTTSAAVRPRWAAPRAVLPAALPAVLAAAAAGALLLPWWRADRGAVLLDGDAVAALPPDVWTGVEVAGPWAAVLVGPAAVAVVAVAAGATGLGRRRHQVARWTSAAAGVAAVAVAGQALVGWGPTGAVGVWVTLLTGLAAVGCAVALPGRAWRAAAQRATPPVAAGRPTRHAGIGVLAVVAVVAVVPGPGALPAAAGPFVPVAAVGAFPLRSGAAGLAATDDVRPVLADGDPGVVSRAGIVVTTHGRARVLARPDRGAPAPIGVVGDRVVRWISADAVAVSELRADSSVDVVVRGVAEAGVLGADGSLWLRTDDDPAGTVRRLDVARLVGEQRIAATWLPVVTIQEPEPPVDLRTVLPVRGGGLRTLAEAGRLELLTGTAAGITTTPLAGRRCGAAGIASLDLAAADRSGIWFVLVSSDGARLAHLDPDAGGAVRTVAATLPGTVTALTAPGDGSLLFVARGAHGTALWRLPDAAAALRNPGGSPVSCPPAP